MKKLIPATAVAALFAATGAFAQTTPTPAPSTPPAVNDTKPMETTPATPSVRPSTSPVSPVQTGPSLTEAEAKELIDANVISSDNKTVGEVAAIQRDSTGKVTELHADIGGFLGIGETRVRVMPSQFTVSDKQVRLSLTAEQVNALPKMEKK
jgi:hypothetical protein